MLWSTEGTGSEGDLICLMGGTGLGGRARGGSRGEVAPSWEPQTRPGLHATSSPGGCGGHPWAWPPSNGCQMGMPSTQVTGHQLAPMQEWRSPCRRGHRLVIDRRTQALRQVPEGGERCAPSSVLSRPPHSPEASDNNPRQKGAPWRAVPQGEGLGETLGRGHPAEGPQGPQSRLRAWAGLSWKPPEEGTGGAVIKIPGF